MFIQILVVHILRNGKKLAKSIYLRNNNLIFKPLYIIASQRNNINGMYAYNNIGSTKQTHSPSGCNKREFGATQAQG